MDEMYYFQDTYNEYSPGDEFEGECVRCGNEGRVKVLSSIDRIAHETSLIGPFDQKCAYTLKFGKIPPFHTLPETNSEFIYRYLTRKELPDNRDHVRRTLSRMFIIGMVCFIILVIIFAVLIMGYHILLSVTSGFWYNLVTNFWVWLIVFTTVIVRLELKFIHVEKENIANYNPEEDDWFDYIFQKLSWSDYLKTFPKLIRYYLSRASTTIFMVGSVGFMMIFIFGIFFMIFFFLGLLAAPVYIVVMFLPIIYPRKTLRVIGYGFAVIGRMFSSTKIGKDHLENFTNFWEGKIHYEDRNRSYYRRAGVFTIIITALAISIPIIFPNLNFLLWLTDILLDDDALYFADFFTGTGIDGTLAFQYLYLFLAWLFIMLGMTNSRGVFVKFYQLPKQVHYQILTDYHTEESEEEEASVTKSISGLLTSIRGRGDATMKLYCPICKDVMEQDDILSRCPSCAAVYHEGHLFEYLKRKHEMQEDSTCMICKRDMDITT